MDILFKNKTQYSKSAYNEFLEFHCRKFGLKDKVYFFSVTILILLCIIFYFLKKLYLQSFLALIILAIYLIWKLYRPQVLVKKDMNSDKIVKEKVFKYEFYKKYFKLFDDSNFDKIKYMNLYKIFETTNFFYLYIDDENSLLVNKKGFYYGTPEEFSNFLKKNYWFKYRFIKNK